MVDILYTNGDSWTHGSELLDPTYNNIDEFHERHANYRKAHHWPKVLAEKLNLEYMDGSFPGASNDRILRTSISDISDLVEQGRKPLVVIAWTQLHRFELAQREGNWRNFVSPADKSNPKAIQEIWSNWSSDFGDVIRWMVQMISLHSFCRCVGVPVVDFTVFSSSYRLLEDHMNIKELRGYKRQLFDICNITEQALQPSLEAVLKPYPNIKYGPGGHPLELGHRTLASYIAIKIPRQFKIPQGTDTDQLHS